MENGRVNGIASKIVQTSFKMFWAESVSKDHLTILVDKESAEHFLFGKDAEVGDEVNFSHVFVVFAMDDFPESGKSTYSFFAGTEVLNVALSVVWLFIFWWEVTLEGYRLCLGLFGSRFGLFWCGLFAFVL